ncbi:MAG TPA: GNAT family N-acetyltransferase, partial [Chloroflexota bacterium]|nr:GNAT family N-acetyltransferase [Chloroflexota bacterium]
STALIPAASSSGDARQRARLFLERDPLLNYSAARALLYEDAVVAGMAESGEAIVGVAIAGRSKGGEPPLIWLDAIGPVALRRLLATLRRPPRRFLVQRPWMGAVLSSGLGPSRVRHEIELFAGVSVPDARDEVERESREPIAPAIPLTMEALEALRAGSSAWNLAALAEQVARGGEAYGVILDGALVAHAACGFPAGSVEEITHVFTAPGWRRKGLAQAVTLAAARAIHRRGHRPLYRSRTGNTASRRVAERCGLIHFVSVRELLLDARGARGHSLDGSSRIASNF